MWMIPEENTFMANIGAASTSKYWDPVIFAEIDYTGGVGLTKHNFYVKYLQGCKLFVPAMNTATQIFVCGICKPGFLTINDVLGTHTTVEHKATIYDLVGNSNFHHFDFDLTERLDIK